MNQTLKSAASRIALLAAMSALAAALPLSASAQTAAVAAASSLDEIVVTAQKRATNLQDTPIAISVMTADSLEARHVQSLADLGDGAISMVERSAASEFGQKRSSRERCHAAASRLPARRASANRLRTISCARGERARARSAAVAERPAAVANAT